MPLALFPLDRRSPYPGIFIPYINTLVYPYLYEGIAQLSHQDAD